MDLSPPSLRIVVYTRYSLFKYIKEKELSQSPVVIANSDKVKTDSCEVVVAEKQLITESSNSVYPAENAW